MKQSLIRKPQEFTIANPTLLDSIPSNALHRYPIRHHPCLAVNSALEASGRPYQFMFHEASPYKYHLTWITWSCGVFSLLPLSQFLETTSTFESNIVIYVSVWQPNPQLQTVGQTASDSTGELQKWPETTHHQTGLVLHHPLASLCGCSHNSTKTLAKTNINIFIVWTSNDSWLNLF